MSETRQIPIGVLAPRIVGADLNAPETLDTRRNVPSKAIDETVGPDRIIDTPKEARAYLKYLAAHDGGDPTQIGVGSWAHRTLFGLAHSVSLRGPAPRLSSEQPTERAGEARATREPEARVEPELELVDPRTGETVKR